jgi:hypothetical protein
MRDQPYQETAYRGRSLCEAVDFGKAAITHRDGRPGSWSRTLSRRLHNNALRNEQERSIPAKFAQEGKGGNCIIDGTLSIE